MSVRRLGDIQKGKKTHFILQAFRQGSIPKLLGQDGFFFCTYSWYLFPLFWRYLKKSVIVPVDFAMDTLGNNDWRRTAHHVHIHTYIHTYT